MLGGGGNAAAQVAGAGRRRLLLAVAKAGPGWDPVTGLGSPVAANLVASLPAYQRSSDGAGL